MSTSTEDNSWRLVTEFALPSEPGKERAAMERVEEVLQPFALPPQTLERLGTAVAEATMNAMEHGNHYRPDVSVGIRVDASADSIRVGITDQGDPIPLDTAEPDLELKLAGLQTPRGWGMFLIKNMVDDMKVMDDESGHTLVLTIHREESGR